ncbi:MAG: fructosamine kinase family protein, partial [Candidatus Saccharimonadales bacterium]
MAGISDFQTALARRIIEQSSDAGVIGWQRLGTGVGGTRWRVQTPRRHWFVKSAADTDAVFTAEADGLRALAACNAVRVPQVLDAGEIAGTGYIVMEWLPLQAKSTFPHAAVQLGQALARQHKNVARKFGWAQRNFIGGTAQINTFSDDWLSFLRQHRLGFQLRLAAENGYRGELQSLGVQLIERLPEFFIGYQPQASLLHGDLWGGNWGVLENGEPVS